MKLFICSIIIILSFSCSKKSTQKQKKETVTNYSDLDSSTVNLTPAVSESKEEETLHEKIDFLNSITEKENNQDIYLGSYKNKKYSACCFDRLSNLFGNDMTESVKQTLKIYQDSIYYRKVNEDSNLITQFRNGENILELYNYNDSRFGNRTSISQTSHLIDSSVNFPNGVKIGMSKRQFTELFFTNIPDSIYNDIVTFSICITEIGDDYTNYNFKNDTLNFNDFKRSF